MSSWVSGLLVGVCLRREELLCLGSLPRNKKPLETVDWENDISLK